MIVNHLLLQEIVLMKKENLTQSERSALRKQSRPALLLGTILFVGVSVVNHVFYFQDVLLGTPDIGRPPIAQLIIIEVVALVLGFISYYFPSKKVIKDLSTNEKTIEEQKVLSTFVKNENGQPNYMVRLANSMIIAVERELFKSIKQGDSLEVSYAPNSELVFNSSKINL